MSVVEKPVVSVVIPMKDEAEALPLLYAELRQLCLANKSVDWEIVCVDDGSMDKTWDTLRSWDFGEISLLRVQLKRNYKKELALLVGSKISTGNGVLTLDADLQHSLSIVPQMVELWRLGSSVVVTKPVVGYSMWLRFVVRAQSLLVKLFGFKPNVGLVGRGDFRLISRVVVNQLTDSPRLYMVMRAEIDQLNMPTSEIYINYGKRAAGKSKYNFWVKFWLGLKAVLGYSRAAERIFFILVIGLIGLWFLTNFFVWLVGCGLVVFGVMAWAIWRRLNQNVNYRSVIQEQL